MQPNFSYFKLHLTDSAVHECESIPLRFRPLGEISETISF